MRELSFESEALLAEARAAFAPSAAARERIRSGVAARLAAGAAAAAAGSAQAAPGSPEIAPAGSAAGGGGALGSSALVKLAATAAIAAGLVMSGWAVWRAGDEETRAPRMRAASPAPVEIQPVAPPEPAERVTPERVTREERVAEPAPRRPARAASGSDDGDLAREVALLRAARRAIDAGHPDRALALLRRHRRLRAPQMERELLLLRAEALCRAGSVAAGREALASAGGSSTAGAAAVSQACEAAE